MIKTLAASALALGLMTASAHAADTTDPVALFAQYVKVLNAKDVAGLRALISDEVARNPYEGCTAAMSNKECLVHYVNTTVLTKNGHIAATESFGVDGDTMYAGLVLKSDVVSAAGVERAYGIDKIKFKDGKIMGLWFLPNLGDAQTKKFLDRVREGGAHGAPAANR